MNAVDLNGLGLYLLGHNPNGSCRGSDVFHKVTQELKRIANDLRKPLAEAQLVVDIVGAVSEVLAVGSALTGDEVGAAFFAFVGETAGTVSQVLGAYDVAATCIETKDQCVAGVTFYAASGGFVTSDTAQLFVDILQRIVSK